MKFTFDPPETGWSVNAQGSIIADPSAPTQPNVLHLDYNTSFPAAAGRVLTDLVVGQSYRVWVWINFDGDAGGQTTCQISYNDSVGEFLVNLNKQFDEETGEPITSGWELRDCGLLHYNFANRVFRIRLIGSVVALAFVRVDAIYIGESPPLAEHVSKRKDIRKALVQRIETVKIANGYDVDVQTVSTGAVRLPDGIENTPHVTVMYPDQEFSIQAMQRLRAIAHFVIGIACKANDTESAEDLLDDTYSSVCRAITLGPIDPGSDGMWLALPWVHYVFVASETSEQITDEVAADLALMHVVVDVHYAFEHGNF